jgi:SM-20-related protein
MEWQDGWGGETLFYDEGNKEIIYGSKFTPNRVVVFDGNIPHNIKHQNRIADKYRMSLSIFFNK